MSYLPIELHVAGREVALLGDDAEIRAKIPRLLAAGARVVLFDAGTPVSSPLPAEIEVREGLPSQAELARFLVVFAAPDLGRTVAEVARRAQKEGRLFCVLDRPELSTFANPAMVEGPIALRIFGGGAAPALTKRLRQELERAFGDARFGRFVAELAERRRSWPRPERARRTREALDGFALEVAVRLPSWFADTRLHGESAQEDGDKS